MIPDFLIVDDFDMSIETNHDLSDKINLALPFLIILDPSHNSNAYRLYFPISHNDVS